MIVDVSATDMSAVFLLKDVSFSVGKSSSKYTEFGMTKIDE
jgi:hypothetical protein